MENSTDPSEVGSSGLELGLLDTGNILRIEVHLDHKPGTLGAFAALLKEHDANVINMEYSEDISVSSALFSIVTMNTSEIDSLLRDMNSRGFTTLCSTKVQTVMRWSISSDLILQSVFSSSSKSCSTPLTSRG